MHCIFYRYAAILCQPISCTQLCLRCLRTFSSSDVNDDVRTSCMTWVLCRANVSHTTYIFYDLFVFLGWNSKYTFVLIFKISPGVRKKPFPPRKGYKNVSADGGLTLIELRFSKPVNIQGGVKNDPNRNVYISPSFFFGIKWKFQDKCRKHKHIQKHET